jgi:hypothetical protein
LPSPRSFFQIACEAASVYDTGVRRQ